MVKLNIYNNDIVEYSYILSKKNIEFEFIKNAFIYISKRNSTISRHEAYIAFLKNLAISIGKENNTPLTVSKLIKEKLFQYEKKVIYIFSDKDQKRITL